jgi:SAM-dependent methyltransferase
MGDADTTQPQHARYERIGHGYADKRRADPRWAEIVRHHLGSARTVLNIGAGTGNYEPTDRSVIALEPSLAMIAQRSSDAAKVVRGVAEMLPFAKDSFEAATAFLTVHHWVGQAQGLSEMKRVSRRQLLTVFEPTVFHSFWALDYFPEWAVTPMERQAPTPDFVAEHLDVVEVVVLMMPHDFTDGMGAANWRRPAEYLDPAVQASISGLAMLPAQVREAGSRKLASDIESGRWQERYGHLLELDEVDLGYRLVIANCP